MALKAAHSRAARAWLEWSQDDLAAKAKVSLSTVRDFEKGKRTPIANNLSAIERAFLAAGIQCDSTENGNPAGISVIDASEIPTV